MEIADLLQLADDTNASDIILVVGSAPALRVDGSITLTDLPPLSPKESERLIFSMLSKEQIEEFQHRCELDISFNLSGLARFRVNVHKQRGSVAAAMRRIAFKIPSLDELRLPKRIIMDICRLRSGLVLVTGHSGSGKSTTLASMIDIINTQRACHIITIEDPVEYLHKHKKSLVEQREIFKDSPSFASALRHVVRQNPDIILIGEMRDLETISTAITASETGHLVFATLHTIDASETVNRIIDVFPWRQQQQIRVQLASTIRAVISQKLLPQAHGKGLIVSCEVMLGIPAVRTLVRDGNVHQLQNVIETSAKYGMHSMDQSLIDLYNKKYIDKDELLFNIKDKQREEIRSII